MFDEYAKKLKDIKANVPAVFERVAKQGAVKARNEAVKITDKEKLVDTGAYKRNWHAEGVEVANDTYGVTLINSMEYASHLEWGHKLRNGKRWKGRFVGRQAIDETRYFCIQKLDEMFEKLYTKYQRGFTTPDS